MDRPSSDSDYRRQQQQPPSSPYSSPQVDGQCRPAPVHHSSSSPPASPSLYGQNTTPSSSFSTAHRQGVYGSPQLAPGGGWQEKDHRLSSSSPPLAWANGSPISSTAQESRRATFHGFGDTSISVPLDSQARRTRLSSVPSAEAEAGFSTYPSSPSSSSRPIPPPLPPPPLGPNRLTMYSSSYSSHRNSFDSRSPPLPPPPPPPWLLSSPRSPSASSPPSSAQSVLEIGEEEELCRVLELSRLTHQSEVAARTWAEGVELVLSEEERAAEQLRQKEGEDLEKAMGESLRISAEQEQGRRAGWVDEEVWGERTETLVASSSSVPQPTVRTSSSRRALRPLTGSSSSSTQGTAHPSLDATQSHSYPFNLAVASSSLAFSPLASSTNQPLYSRAISLPIQSSSSSNPRLPTTRRNGASLYLANPSVDTPLPNLVEAAYTNKGASEFYNASVLPTIRGETWEGSSVGTGSGAGEALRVAKEDAIGEDGLLRDVEVQDEEDEEAGGEDEDDRLSLPEPDEAEIDLQRRRREELRRESSGGGSREVDAGGAVDEQGNAVLPSVPADPVPVPMETRWGGLDWGHTTLSPPRTASAAPLSLHPLPPSDSLSSISIPAKSQGAFYIQASSYSALLSGLFTQAKSTIVGSGCYHLAIQFVRLTSSSAASSDIGEFSTILWIEDAGLEPAPLSPSSPHGLAGLHNGFRSSVFHPSTIPTSSNVPTYIPSPSHIVKTSSNLVGTRLLQPLNTHHLSRYNSPSSNPPPQPQNTTLLAIPPSQPPTITINQLVSHLHALTTPSPTTKAISKRLTTLVAQYSGGTSPSSRFSTAAEDFVGLGNSGSGEGVASGGGGEDWYDDADDRVVAGGGGMKSWLKHTKTMVVSKAGRSGRQALKGKSETLAAASFITPFSIPATATEPQPPRRES